MCTRSLQITSDLIKIGVIGVLSRDYDNGELLCFFRHITQLLRFDMWSQRLGCTKDVTWLLGYSPSINILNNLYGIVHPSIFTFDNEDNCFFVKEVHPFLQRLKIYELHVLRYCKMRSDFRNYVTSKAL